MGDKYIRTEQDKAIAAANMQQLINTHGLFIHPKEYRENVYRGNGELGNLAAFIQIPHTQGGILESGMLNVINDFMEAFETNPTAEGPTVHPHELIQNITFATLTFTDAGVAKLLEAGLSSPTLDILSGKNKGKWTVGKSNGTPLREQHLGV